MQSGWLYVCAVCVLGNECNKDRDINKACSKAKVGTQRASVCLFDGAASVCLLPCQPRLDNQRPDLTLRWGHGPRLLTLQKALAGLGWLAGLILLAAAAGCRGKEGREDGTGLDWNCGLSRQEIASKHLRAGNGGELGSGSCTHPWCTSSHWPWPTAPAAPLPGLWAGPAEFRLCMSLRYAGHACFVARVIFDSTAGVM